MASKEGNHIRVFCQVICNCLQEGSVFTALRACLVHGMRKKRRGWMCIC